MKSRQKKLKHPCQYTPQEMIERMEQGVKDAENGLTITVKELRKKYSKK